MAISMYFFWLKRKKLRGYTIAEVVSALAAFTIIMMVVSQIFGRSMASYREVKKTQNNLQGAQSTLNLMAKELRTSSVVASSPGASVSTLKFFDYSQNRCIEYSFSQTLGSITRRSAAYVDPDPTNNTNDEQVLYCTSYTFTSSPETLLTGLTGQAIQVVNSSNSITTPVVGKVTVVVTLGTGSSQTSLQTTVSLRDFNYTGL